MGTTANPAADSTHDLETWNDFMEQTLDLIGETVVSNLSVSYLLMYMDLDDLSLTRRLHHLEHNGNSKEAAKELLAAIKKSTNPGKWKVFVNALKEMSGEDSIILHHLLQRGPTDPWLDNPIHRKLITLFIERIHKNVNIEALMARMIQDGLISEHHRKPIMATLKNGHTAYAHVELIFAMQSHKTNWYRKFVTMLYEDENTRLLAEDIDPDFCRDKLAEVKRKEAEESRQKQERQGNLPSGDHSGNGAGNASAESSKRGAENDHSDPSHCQIMGTPDPHPREVSCCCSQLRTEVTSLNSTVLLLHSEINEVKEILKELVKKVSK